MTYGLLCNKCCFSSCFQTKLKQNKLYNFIICLNICYNIQTKIMGAEQSTPSQNQLQKEKQVKQLQQLKKQLQQKNNKLNKLKQQNEKLIKTKLSKNLKSQYTIESLMKLNQEMFTCGMCQMFFDQDQRLPKMICINQHTICQICQKQNANSQCSVCKQKIQVYGKNRSILHLIQNKEELLEWIKERQLNKINQISSQTKIQYEQIQAQKVSIQMIRFPNYATIFQMNGDTLHKISTEAIWHTVRSKNCLFSQTLNEVSFNIIHSVHNSVIFGITTQSTEFQKGFIPSASVSYHLNNGHIYDMDPVSKANRWRSGGKPVLKGSYSTIRMIVDMIQKKIKWKIGRQTFAQTIFNQSFQKGPTYIYISLFHRGDIVVLNK